MLKLIAGYEGQLIRAYLLNTVPDDSQDTRSILDEIELIFPVRVQREEELGLVALHYIKAIFIGKRCYFL